MSNAANGHRREVLLLFVPWFEDDMKAKSLSLICCFGRNNPLTYLLVCAHRFSQCSTNCLLGRVCLTQFEPLYISAEYSVLWFFCV